jgi:hypothetical protein
METAILVLLVAVLVIQLLLVFFLLKAYTIAVTYTTEMAEALENKFNIVISNTLHAIELVDIVAKAITVAIKVNSPIMATGDLLKAKFKEQREEAVQKKIIKKVSKKSAKKKK